MDKTENELCWIDNGIYCRGAWKKKVVGGKELVAAGKRKSTVGSDAAESGTKRHDDVESVSSVAV
jgi:hypothetical protein